MDVEQAEASAFPRPRWGQRLHIDGAVHHHVVARAEIQLTGSLRIHIGEGLRRAAAEIDSTRPVRERSHGKISGNVKDGMAHRWYIRQGGSHGQTATLPDSRSFDQHIAKIDAAYPREVDRGSRFDPARSIIRPLGSDRYIAMNRHDSKPNITAEIQFGVGRGADSAAALRRTAEVMGVGK